MIGYIIATIVVFLGGMLAAHFHGRRRGRKDENDRCYRLCHQAILQRSSGTLSWAMNAIGDPVFPSKLLPEKRFFGETLREKRLRESREFQERRLKTKDRDIIDEALEQQCTCRGLKLGRECEGWCGIFVLPKWP